VSARCRRERDRVWEREAGLGYIAEYLDYIRGFSRNAKLYLVSSLLGGIGLGLVHVVFNLYLLRVGLDESFLGLLVFCGSIAGVLFALPAGRASDLFGRKGCLVAALLVGAGGTLIQVLVPLPGLLVPVTFVTGGAWAVSMITSAPLLVESSRREERAHLFGLHFALTMGSEVIGANLGGLLPRLTAPLYDTAPDAVEPLSLTLIVGVALMLASLVPLLPLREERRAVPPVRTVGTAWFRLSDSRLVAKILLPSLLISLGAGLIMPLQNVFMDRHLGAGPAQIGLILALGSLMTGVASLVAPFTAQRWGKVRAAAGCQALSLPFLVVMGFVPNLWVFGAASLIRCALMNMANPLVTNLNMEIVPGSERATVNSLVNMAWSLGWAVSGWAGGWIRVLHSTLRHHLCSLRHGHHPVLLVLPGLRPAAGQGRVSGVVRS